MQTIKGMILNESNEEYHKNKCISFSNLKEFRKRPLLLKKRLDGLVEHKDSSVFTVGSAAHCAVLEPLKFHSEYAFAPVGHNGASKEGKAFKAECIANGLTLLNASETSLVKGLVESVNGNEIAKALLENGAAEITWRLNGELYGYQCRTDWFCESAPAGLKEKYGEYMPDEGEPYVFDYKTTRDLDDWKDSTPWKNPLISFDYAGQQQFYLMVINTLRGFEGLPPVKHWLFVVSEKEEPKETAVIKASHETCMAASDRLSKDMSEIEECFTSGVWKSSFNGVLVSGIE